jgi:hypothetical protein
MTPSTKPVIHVVDPDGDVSNTVGQLMIRYSHDYTIVVDTDVVSASQRMGALEASASDVALILADRAANGAMLLDEARTVHPHARRALLLNWNESRSNREEIAEAFAQRRAEGFVTKPSGTPDERFHRSITELLDEWWRIRSSHHRVRRRCRTNGGCSRCATRCSAYAFRLERADPSRCAVILQAVASAVTPLVVVLHDGRTLVDPPTSKSPMR